MTVTAQREQPANPPAPKQPRVRIQDTLDLAALRTAVVCSRLFTRYTLTRWGAPSLVDDAGLIVSELVTNAVKATGFMGDEPAWSELDELKLIKVRMVALEASVILEVWDTSPDLPVLATAGEDDESGRGLLIVDQLAKRWGAYHQPRGKVVWAELPVTRRKVKVVQPDQETLRRLIDGLQCL